MRETGHLRGKSLITGQLIPQGKVPLFNRILLRIMQEVLFVAKQTSKINKDHHTPPEGVVVVEGNDYPVDLAPGGRLQYYYLIWDQKEYHPRVDHFSTSNRIVTFSHNSQRLRRSSKTKVSVGLCSGNASKESDYSGKNECKPGFLQQVVSGAKAREKMEASDRPKCDRKICFDFMWEDVRSSSEPYLSV